MKGKFILSSLIIVPIFALPFLLMIENPSSSPTFWNYEQHISETEGKNIRQAIGYNTFGDLDQLEAAIYSNKVISAISSDYQAAQLAQKNVIQKLNFKLMWDIEYDNSEQLGQILEKIYTPLTFNALDQAFNLGNKGKLWEYVIPYAIQEKVIAFNINKGQWNPEQKSLLKTPKGVNEIFEDRSYQGILNTLKNNGYSRLLINDYIRDNMMIGSEISPGGFNSLPTFKTYKTQIDNFKTTIEQGFGQKITSNNVTFETDSSQILQNLINPKKAWDTSIMYNGDSLNAYESLEHFPNLDDNHFVGVVFPNNPVYLIDTLIIPHYIKGKLLTKAYDAIKSFLFKNAEVAQTVLDEIPDLHEPSEDYPILINFNYIAYSLPYKIYDQSIKERYFKNEAGEDDVIAAYIYSITEPNTGDYQKYFIQQVDDSLFTAMFYYYLIMKN